MSILSQSPSTTALTNGPITLSRPRLVGASREEALGNLADTTLRLGALDPDDAAELAAMTEAAFESALALADQVAALTIEHAALRGRMDRHVTARSSWQFVECFDCADLRPCQTLQDIRQAIKATSATLTVAQARLRRLGMEAP